MAYGYTDTGTGRYDPKTAGVQQLGNGQTTWYNALTGNKSYGQTDPYGNVWYGNMPNTGTPTGGTPNYYGGSGGSAMSGSPLDLKGWYNSLWDEYANPQKKLIEGNLKAGLEENSNAYERNKNQLEARYRQNIRNINAQGKSNMPGYWTNKFAIHRGTKNELANLGQQKYQQDYNTRLSYYNALANLGQSKINGALGLLPYYYQGL